MRKVVFVTLLMCCVFMMNACVSMMPTKEQQEVKTIVSVKASYDKVWKALVQTLMEENYKIKTLDKDTGSIQTEDIIYKDSYAKDFYAKDQLKKISYMPSIMLSIWNAYKYNFSILLYDIDKENITINIKATIAGYEKNVSGDWIECYSNGTLEQALINSVKKKLGITEMQQ